MTLPASDQLYYLKLVTPWDKKTPIVAMTGRGGQTIEGDVPIGTYILKFQSGSVWYGDEQRFGPGAPSTEMLARMEFSKKGRELTGHEVTLIEQLNGNLRKEDIAPQDF